MDFDLIISAIGKQLDALDSLVASALGLALVSAWAGLQRSSEVSILSMKVARRDAFYILGAAFLYVNVAAIFYFMRIGDLLNLVGKSSLPKALTVLGTHAWPFNPYAYFGDSLSSLCLSNLGYGSMIAIWWIGYTALASVQDDKTALGYRIVVGAFLAVGLVSMGAIQYVFLVILGRIDDLNDGLRTSIAAQAIPRSIFTFVGIGVGGLIFAVAQKLQAIRAVEFEAAKSSQST